MGRKGKPKQTGYIRSVKMLKEKRSIKFHKRRGWTRNPNPTRKNVEWFKNLQWRVLPNEQVCIYCVFRDTTRIKVWHQRTRRIRLLNFQLTNWSFSCRSFFLPTQAQISFIINVLVFLILSLFQGQYFKKRENVLQATQHPVLDLICSKSASQCRHTGGLFGHLDTNHWRKYLVSPGHEQLVPLLTVWEESILNHLNSPRKRW